MLSVFLRDLFSTGRVTVPKDGVASDGSAAVLVLRRRHEAVCTTLAGDPPPFDDAVAMQAAECFASWAERFVRDPEMPLPEVAAAGTPSEWLAVDLTMRFAPDLQRLIRASARDAELLAAVSAAIAAHPLLPPCPADHCGELLEDLSLRLLYLERLVSGSSDEGWEPPEVRAALAADAAASRLPPAAAGRFARYDPTDDAVADNAPE